MHLVVVSHKLCWPSAASPSGYATDGGFPLQMRALSELFERTTLVLPCAAAAAGAVPRPGELPLMGRALRVVPLEQPAGADFARKISLPGWLARNLPRLAREVRAADVVHTPIPSDIGTFGMVLAWAARKPLFVRHCGNWARPRTVAERLWRWSLERTAGGRTAVLTTGGSDEAPSARNPHLRWIFSTSLTAAELDALTAAPAGATPPSAAALRLVIVCRQEELKGTGVVLDAVPTLAEAWPGVHLDVVGDGSALEAFRAQAAAQGIADRVTFHGKLDHDGVVRVLRGAHLFTYPTAASEGFPKVVLEAMACGLPVVATPVSVLPDLMRGGGGVLIPRPEAALLARAVADCAGDPGRYRAMAAAAAATARGYSLERWRDAIAEHLTAHWGAPLASSSLGSRSGVRATPEAAGV